MRDDGYQMVAMKLQDCKEHTWENVLLMLGYVDVKLGNKLARVYQKDAKSSINSELAMTESKVVSRRACIAPLFGNEPIGTNR
jgi:hypothetical protein